MIDQIITLSDVPRVFFLAFLELFLSSDNAIVIAVLSHSLPARLRRKALLIGITSAFFFRAAALLAISYLLVYTWIELLGAAYLLYLCIRYFTNKGKSIRPPGYSFWQTLFLIELLDLVFALDSIVAGIAFIDAAIPKLWIVYVGGMIGLISIRYAAALFGILIDRFPRLEASAYLMVGWIGIKLGAATLNYPIPAPLFWSVFALFFLLGFFRPKR